LKFCLCGDGVTDVWLVLVTNGAGGGGGGADTDDNSMVPVGTDVARWQDHEGGLMGLAEDADPFMFMLLSLTLTFVRPV